MTESILKEFLLFNFTGWLSFGDKVLALCKHSATPIFIFALIFDASSKIPNPSSVLKRFFIALLIIFSIPIYYEKVVEFGFDLGDSILKEQKSGLISNWLKFKRMAESQSKKEKIKTDVLTTVKSFFYFDGSDYVEKAAAILIFICILMIKIIYSTVYYCMYCASGILAVLSIFPGFQNHTLGILKSILYLIITVVLVALVLSFMNEILVFEVSDQGFIKTLSGIAQFIVLCFVLLGTLKIAQSIVNGKGAEGWAGNMGSMLGAGLAFKSMGAAVDISEKGVKQTLSSSVNGVNSLAKSSQRMAAPLAYMASRPLVSSFNSTTSNIKRGISDKTDSISREKGISQNLLSQSSKSYQEHPILGRYERSLNSVASNSKGNITTSSVLNPVNHLKASVLATKGMSSNLYERTKSRLGIPEDSNKLTVKEKSLFVANKMMNSPKKISQDELIKNQIIATKISKALDKNYD